MKFEYTGRHIDVTPALQAHVEGHFEKLRHLFDGHEALAHVIIEVLRGRHRSEIIIRWRDKVFNADTSDADMYQSLSKTIEKIEKQILRLKTKVTDKHHKRTKLGELPEEESVFEVGLAPRIRNERNYLVKPMTAEDAVLHLEDDSNQFLVFRDSESERISVIYKRSDGDFGLIQPS